MIAPLAALDLVMPIRFDASATTPYVESHAVGKLWLGVLVASGVIELAGALRRRREASRRDAGSQVVLRLCMLGGVALLAASLRIAPGAEIRPPFVAAIVGCVVMGSGEALRVWAKAALGRLFTYSVQTSADQPVISSGPYRWVRHPSYTGLVLIAVGAGLGWGNWLGLLALAALVLAGVRYRIHVEERALLEDLGERYRAYAEHRKRLVPGVW